MTSEQLAWKIRRHGIEMTHLSGGSHIGAILSIADIIAVLYSGVMNIDPGNPKKDSRDRFILSKGHAGASIYAALAENGFFEVEELKTHYQNGSRLSGHVSHHVPGVDFSTGSLGHGLSAGTGMAYAAKKDGKDHKVYVVLGDGECDEGSVWEAALFANHFRLSNLIAIVDHNHMQSMDFQENTLEIEDFGEKWKACFHLIFFEQSFNNPPIGKNKSIFNRFSSRSIKSCSKITLLHDQNGSNSYILFPGVRVNTVDAKTILKKIYNATPAKN